MFGLNSVTFNKINSLVVSSHSVLDPSPVRSDELIHDLSLQWGYASININCSHTIS